jgi:hypothetical protein
MNLLQLIALKKLKKSSQISDLEEKPGVWMNSKKSMKSEVLVWGIQPRRINKDLSMMNHASEKSKRES